jgi:2-hydroxy-6-oxonona-2,4-dienedioate hydrolase
MSIWTDLMAQPFRQTYYNAGGRKTRVLEAGEGKPLIFLHGTGGHAEAYIRNIGPHARHFHVYCVDMIGHGYSDRPDVPYSIMDFVAHVRDFLDTIQADKAMVSGESLGAVVGAWLAVTEPRRVEKLVLNTGILMPLAEKGMQEMRDVLARSRSAAAGLTRETVRKRLEWLMHDPKGVTDELIDVRYQIYAQPGMTPVMGKVAASILGGTVDPAWAAKWLNPDKLAEIQCPTLVLWSRYNPGQPAELAELGAKRIPNSKMVVLEDCAHWPQWEVPERFNAEHLKFLLA